MGYPSLTVVVGKELEKLHAQVRQKLSEAEDEELQVESELRRLHLVSLRLQDKKLVVLSRKLRLRKEANLLSSREKEMFARELVSIVWKTANNVRRTTAGQQTISKRRKMDNRSKRNPRTITGGSQIPADPYGKVLRQEAIVGANLEEGGEGLPTSQKHQNKTTKRQTGSRQDRTIQDQRTNRENTLRT